MNLGGKTIQSKITINKIKKQVLPKLDEKMIKELNPECSNEEELRTEIRKNMISQAEENEKRKFQRDSFIRSWKEWLSLENTQQALLPIIVVLFVSAFIGWSAGVSKNSCNPYFEQNLDQSI